MDYPFEKVVPEDIQNVQVKMPGSEGVPGSVMKVAKSAATMSRLYTKLKW